MSMAFRLSTTTVALCAELIQTPTDWRYGYDLIKATGIAAGTIYPILHRMAGAGWLETRWTGELESGRPPRQMYRLTGEGLRGARDMIARASERGWLTGRLAASEG